MIRWEPAAYGWSDALLALLLGAVFGALLGLQLVMEGWV